MSGKTKIKLLALDIDGVLTDGRIIIDALGNECKSINYRDLDGINWLKSKGLNLALLTGEDTAFVDTIARRFGITNIVKGAKDKEKALCLKHATWILMPQGLRRALTVKHLYYQLNAVPVLIPRLHFLEIPRKILIAFSNQIRSILRIARE